MKKGTAFRRAFIPTALLLLLLPGCGGELAGYYGSYPDDYGPYYPYSDYRFYDYPYPYGGYYWWPYPSYPPRDFRYRYLPAYPYYRERGDRPRRIPGKREAVGPPPPVSPGPGTIVRPPSVPRERESVGRPRRVPGEDPIVLPPSVPEGRRSIGRPPPFPDGGAFRPPFP